MIEITLLQWNIFLVLSLYSLHYTFFVSYLLSFTHFYGISSFFLFLIFLLSHFHLYPYFAFIFLCCLFSFLFLPLCFSLLHTPKLNSEDSSYSFATVQMHWNKRHLRKYSSQVSRSHQSIETVKLWPKIFYFKHLPSISLSLSLSYNKLSVNNVIQHLLNIFLLIKHFFHCQHLLSNPKKHKKKINNDRNLAMKTFSLSYNKVYSFNTQFLKFDDFLVKLTPLPINPENGQIL